MTIVQSVFFKLCAEKHFTPIQDRRDSFYLKRGKFKSHRFTDLEVAIKYLRNFI